MVNGETAAESSGIPESLKGSDKSKEQELIEDTIEQETDSETQEDDKGVSEEEKERGVSVAPGGGTDAGYYEGGEQIASEEDVQEGLEEGKSPQEIREQGLRDTDQRQELLEAKAEAGDRQAQEIVEQQDFLERVEKGGLTQRELEVSGGMGTVQRPPGLEDLGISQEVAGRAGEGTSSVITSENQLRDELGLDEKDTVATGKQREIERAESFERNVSDRADEAKEDIRKRQERDVGSARDLLEQVESGELPGIETEGGEVLRGDEAEEYLRNRIEEIKSIYQGQISDIEETVAEERRKADVDIKRFEAQAERDLAEDPLGGVSSESAFQDLSRTERASVAAEASIGGAPVEVTAGLLRGGLSEGREEVVERFTELRGATLDEDVTGSFIDNLSSGVALKSAGRAGVLMGSGAVAGAAGEALVGGAGAIGAGTAKTITSSSLPFTVKAATGAKIGQTIGFAADVGTGLVTAGQEVEEGIQDITGRDIGGGLIQLSPLGGVDLTGALKSFSAKPTSEAQVERGSERLTRMGFFGVSAVGGAAQAKPLSQPSNFVSGVQSVSDALDVNPKSVFGRFEGFVSRGVGADEVKSVRSFQSGVRNLETGEFEDLPGRSGRALSTSTEFETGGTGLYGKGVSPDISTSDIGSQQGVLTGFDEVRRRPVTAIQQGDDASVVQGYDPLRFFEVETESGRTLRFATSTDLAGRLDDGFEGVGQVNVLEVGEDARVYDPTEFGASRQIVDVEAEGSRTVLRSDPSRFDFDEQGFKVYTEQGSGLETRFIARTESVGRAGDVDFEVSGRQIGILDETEEGFVETTRGVSGVESRGGRGLGQVESETVVTDLGDVDFDFGGRDFDFSGLDDAGDTSVPASTRIVENADEIGETARSIYGDPDPEGGDTGGFISNLFDRLRNLGDDTADTSDAGTVSGSATTDFGTADTTDFGDTGVRTGYDAGGQTAAVRGRPTPGFDTEGVSGDALFTEGLYSSVGEAAVRQYTAEVTSVDIGGRTSPLLIDGGGRAEPDTVETEPFLQPGIRGQVERFQVETVEPGFESLGRADTDQITSPGTTTTQEIGTGRAARTGRGTVTQVGTFGQTGVDTFPATGFAPAEALDVGQIQQTGFGRPFAPTAPTTPSFSQAGPGGLGLPSFDLEGEGGLGLGPLDVGDVDLEGGRGRPGLGVITASEAEFRPGVERATLPDSPSATGSVFGVLPVELDKDEDEDDEENLGFTGLGDVEVF